jgi:hypothetical protein
MVLHALLILGVVGPLLAAVTVGSTLAGEDHLEDIEVADLAGLATFHGSNLSL